MVLLMFNWTNTKIIAFWLVLLRGLLLNAQQVLPIDGYIKEGLANNATLKTQGFDLERSVVALEEAKTLFQPRVNFQMQYTLAAGGRNIEFPIGDLLNPAYTALNKLTQTQNFPQLENQKISFLPNNFHDTKIHAVYPLLNKEITYNRDIKKELITVEQAKINVYKRELVKTIKLAYVQYLQASQAVLIYKNALGLVRENLRVNEKLLKNDVATNAPVLKAKMEVSKVENSIVEAESNVKNAAAYFNFLLNKPFDATIQTTDKSQLTSQAPPQYSSNLETKREEFAQIKGAERVFALQKKMNDSYQTPKIGAALDLGFQGFGFKVWDKQAYGLLGLQMDIPLYTGGSNKIKLQQNELDLRKLRAQTAEILQQIQLQIQVAQTNLTTAQAALKVNDAELLSAKEYYRLTDRRYREGQALQIEVVDAQTQLTTTELKRSLAEFTILKYEIELERAMASYGF